MMGQLKFLIVLTYRLGTFYSHNMPSAQGNCKKEGDREALWSERARVTLAAWRELEGWSGILRKTCALCSQVIALCNSLVPCQ